MSVNKYKPHLFILPEDDANSQLALGFIDHNNVQYNRVQIRTPAGGWKKVLENFEKYYAPGMRECPERMMVLLIDFDNDGERLERIREQEILQEFSGRVYVLGVQSEPERLKERLKNKTGKKSFTEIGKILEQDAQTTEMNYGQMSCFSITKLNWIA